MTTEDRQKRAIYEWQSKLCDPVGDEELSLEAAESVLEALWENRVDSPLDSPTLSVRSESGHFYDPWDHSIQMDSTESSVPVVHLLHEAAHAVIGAMGVGPVTASHGPLFCYEFGKAWSLYTTKDFSEWERRCNRHGLFVAKGWPDLEGYDWAVVQEDGSCYAMRPAQKAVRMGYNIRETFEDITDHPLSRTRSSVV